MKQTHIHTPTKSRILLLLALGITALLFPLAGSAQTSFTINNSVADAFVAKGTNNGNLAGLNFGGAGTLAIAPASSHMGEFDSLVEFNTSAAVAQFNSTYGVGNWTITGFQLMLASNFATQGQQPNNTLFNTINAGSFGIDWLFSNSWTEGTGGGTGANNGAVSLNSIPGLLAGGYDSLGSYTYTPPGNANYLTYALQFDSGLATAAQAGGNVSLYFFAADNQVSYLFNSKEFASNHPEFILTASPVPEPGTVALVAMAAAGLMAARRRS